LDLIVTDHHLPQAEGVPRALAVLNPNQPGCAYPCKALCGAGVAFKLVQALMEHAGRERLLPSFLKMVAIATIADAVPLVGENRVIARLGLDGLRSAVNPGLKALIEFAGLDSGRRVTASDVAFRIAPRINAAGRMDIAQTVVELFCTRDEARARELAQTLHQLNADRQDEERRIMAEIESRLEGDPELRQAFCMVVDGDGWHRGVIGIAATRVVEQHGRPAIVVTRDGEEAHGSGRSIPAFHLLDSLESCAHLFTRYGGHAHAVGFALPADRVPELRVALDRHARERLTLADFEQVQEIDAEVTLAQITPEFFCALEQLQPFGMDNRAPVFVARSVKVVLPAQVLKDEHLKLRVFQAGPQGGRALDALGWWMAERLQNDPLLAGDLLDIAFTVERNSHPEFAGLQIRLCDFRRPAAAAGST
jgi:single-stranded-DNA-specific exonuclease